ncbi:hypothetical protein BHM03_00012666 [Ensete ventricosum]|nr:hypothetical protein BHM03_00012666 [Ensete ventricosum]
MVSGACHDAVTERSLSFRNWEPETPKLDESVPTGEQAADDNVTLQPSCLKVPVKFAAPHVKLPQQLVEFSSPRPSSELDAAATKLQKVYKSYRTRRNLADCAVVVEELWCIDPRHRYGHNLHLYYDVWFGSESTQPFFYWLDVGDGREVNLERCPRSKLQKQCISYLGPVSSSLDDHSSPSLSEHDGGGGGMMRRYSLFTALQKEREAYEVIVETGKLVYKQSGMLVNTTEGCKWIFVLSTSRALYVGQKRSVDDDEFPQHKKDDDVDEVAVEAAVAAVEEKAKSEDEIAKEEPKEPKEQGDASREKAAMAFDLGRRLSCRWSTGAGARIGCVRDYPADLQSKALEQVNLSPRVVASPAANKVPPVPIPSPRPSPRVRLSPRLQYMGIPTPPTVSLTLPKSWR